MAGCWGIGGRSPFNSGTLMSGCTVDVLIWAELEEGAELDGVLGCVGGGGGGIMSEDDSSLSSSSS